MITPDSIPWWFAFPVAFVASVAYLIIAVVQAPADPNPEYSRLDRLDGLGSHAQEVRRD